MKDMTRNEYENVCENIIDYSCRAVKCRMFIPSANRYHEALCHLTGVGTGVNRGSLIVSYMGHRHLVYYKNVTMIKR